MFYCTLLIFSSFLPVLCKNTATYPLRWPLYHELYTSAMKSASFSSQFKANEIIGNFSWNQTLDCLNDASTADPVSSILSNSTWTAADNEPDVDRNKARQRTQLLSSLSEEGLKYVLEHSDLLEMVFSGSISMDCLADLYYFAESLKDTRAWALKVVDSLGKPPAGLETGNVIWAGDYEQCLEVAAPVVNVTFRLGPIRYSHPASFNGQYCLLSIVQKGNPAPPVPEGYLLAGLNIGLCTPSQCTENMLMVMATEVEKMFNETLSKLGLQVAGVDCPRKKDYLDGTGILAFIVLVTVLTLVLAGTVCECVLQRRAKASAGILDDVGVGVADQQNDAPVVVSDERALIETGSGGRGVVTRILTSFSILSNGKRLFSTTSAVRPVFNAASVGPSSMSAPLSETVDLHCLYGIRFLSMAWIILGHTYYFSFAMSANPLDRLDPDKRDFWFQAIIQAAYACDTFFLISACLVANHFFSIADRYPQIVGTCRFWATFYLQRFLRLTPPYMLILCVYIGLWKYVGGGPFWPKEGFEVNDCKRTWWSNLLYINNYLNIQYEEHDGVVTGREYCAGWTWYLAVDMQFYWISPLVLYPIFKARQSRRWCWIGYSVLTSFIVLGLVVTGIIARVNELPANMFPADPEDSLQLEGQLLALVLSLREKAEFMKDELFFKPYPHLPCYAVGLILALALRRYRQQGQQGMYKVTVFIGWSLSFSFAMMIIYGLWPNYRGHPFAVDLAACYVATSRLVFSICVAWVAYACLTGHGGFVNTFLSWSFFKPLSRLTFVAYLIHPMFLFAYFFSRQTSFYYTEFVMVWFFGSFLLFSYLAAVGIALVFESPFLTLNRRFVKRSE